MNRSKSCNRPFHTDAGPNRPVFVSQCSMPEIPEEIAAHYNGIDEQSRLAEGDGQLEETRTRIIIERHLPPPPAVVVDIGGGPGVYAHWLAEAGYSVHLRDPMAKHITEAAARSNHGLASAEVGDARRLDFEDDSADAALLLGPLYHLTELPDRIGALREARRVLRPGGVLFAAGVSRFASSLDGLWRNLIADPAFRQIVERDLAEGQHRNPTGHPAYFTTAYFHDPEGLRAEVDGAGFHRPEVLAVEGMGWIMPDFSERWADASNRAHILDLVARTETEPSVLGVSQHLMAVGWKPATPDGVP